MPENFEQSSIWKNIEASNADDDKLIAQKEALRSVFRKFRERAGNLVAHIASEIPSLTIHNITHLDALWETAELIVGENYPFTPIEVFVLGGAILLHDSALCFEAYESGKAGLRATVEWKDSYAVEFERDPNADVSNIEDKADFLALRTLHAVQAEKLANKSWKNEHGEELFLIDDHELRKRYGALIGKIAASHHWSIDRVANELDGQYNAPGYYPRDWRVDPIKLACVLRCADAAHIDDRRAPDFLHALLRRHGLSASHWKAQNWLNRIDIDQQDPTGATLIVTSSHNFEQKDADAWWVAFDATTLVDTELRASNTLLSTRKLTASPPFQAQQVTGVTSPELMSNYIHTDGWEPRSAKLHVSNIEHLILRLGGTSLYGEGDHVFAVAIREMLQNARDAIAARRIIDSSYAGKVIVTLRVDAHDLALWYVDIEDDGVGMSDTVITGPLLDFGTSFWASSLVREEFPGLRSSNFRSVGKFGVGFYSIFMVADAVTVSSRKYDEGLPDIRTLNFPNGLTLRPILSRGRPVNFSTSMSTKISMKLKKNEKNKWPNVEIQRNYIGAQNFSAPLSALISSLVAGSDIDVFFRLNADQLTHVHKPLSVLNDDAGRKDWLSGLSFAGCPENSEAVPLIDRDHKRLRPLIENDEYIGLAALSIEAQDNLSFMSAQTVGGFATSINSRGATTYVGTMDYEPISAKRDARPQPRISRELLEKWSNEQIDILKTMPLEPLNWVAVTYAMSDLEIDPLPIFLTIIWKDDQLIAVTADQILELVKSEPLGIFKSSFMEHVDTHTSQMSYNKHAMFRPVRNSGFLSLEMKDGKPVKPNSFLGCLFRRAEALSQPLSVEIIANAGHSYLSGTVDVMLIKTPGYGLMISAPTPV